MNLNMHGVNKTLAELFVMLKVAKMDIHKNTNHMMMVSKTTRFKKNKYGGKKKKVDARCASNRGKGA